MVWTLPRTRRPEHPGEPWVRDGRRIQNTWYFLCATWIKCPSSKLLRPSVGAKDKTNGRVDHIWADTARGGNYRWGFSDNYTAIKSLGVEKMNKCGGGGVRSGVIRHAGLHAWDPFYVRCWKSKTSNPNRRGALPWPLIPQWGEQTLERLVVVLERCNCVYSGQHHNLWLC